MTLDEILECSFTPCAFAAFVQQARAEGSWPDREKTRQRAYRLYEDGKKRPHQE